MKGWHWATVAFGVLATAYTFAAPDAVDFQEPALARIIFVHLPSALVCSALVFVAAFLGMKSLKTKRPHWDVRLAASLELGALFGGLTMVTGILFSKVQWGEWWQWDPRQTSFLMVLMLLLVGLALRAGHSDERRRASTSAAYSVLTLLPTIFLIFVFPRLPHVQKTSFHPSNTVQTGAIDTSYRIGVYGTLIALALAARWLYLERVKAGLIELEGESHELDDLGRSDTAPTGVVRPVALSEKR